MNMELRKTILSFFLCALLVPLRNVHADNSVESRERSISSSVLSPFCPGRALNDCPSSSATQLRGEIKQMLENGKTEDEIIAHLFKTYGDHIRALPKDDGFGMIGWVAPFIFLFLGTAFLAIWLRGRRQPAAAAPKLQKLDAAMQARVEAEINRID